jgi:hypothetical protein
MVVKAPYIRFYAGIPLSSLDGHRIGVFCIKDIKPRKMLVEDLRALKSLAKWAETELNSSEITKDLIKLKAAEDDLKRYEAIIRDSNDAIIGLKLDGSVNSWNDSARRMFGYGFKETKGKQISSLTVLNSKSESDMLNAKVRSGERVSNYQTQRRRKDGKLIDVALTLSPIRSDAGKLIGISELTRDISIEKQIERQKRELIKKRQQNKLLAEQNSFLATMSHQLRTPVSALIVGLSNLEIIDSNEAKKLIPRLNYRAANLNDIINSLVLYLKISGRPIEHDLRGSSVSIAIDNTRARLKQSCEARSISIQVQNNARGAFIGINAQMAESVIYFLLNNAVSYSRDKGQISVSIDRFSDKVQLTVTDHGIGIPRGEQNRVFERYFRASNAALTKNEGSGVSLYLVKVIVESLSGKVGFESKESEGSNFWITLPDLKFRQRSIHRS